MKEKTTLLSEVQKERNSYIVGAAGKTSEVTRLTGRNSRLEAAAITDAETIKDLKREVEQLRAANRTLKQQNKDDSEAAAKQLAAEVGKREAAEARANVLQAEITRRDADEAALSRAARAQQLGIATGVDSGVTPPSAPKPPP